MKTDTAVPVLALAFASGINVALVVARILWTRHWGCGYLIWNLFLAWLPLFFSMLACEQFERRGWRFWGLAGAWLLFFPNAPYIFTDLIHLLNNVFFHNGAHFWVDMVLILSTALTGLVLGFLSLFLLQQHVWRAYGWISSWLFVLAAAGLAGFGICMGRFQRLNSWDLVVSPLGVLRGLASWILEPFEHPGKLAFPLLFGAFLFVAYVMLYALTHLQQPRRALISS
jgi:uncharacterized membrane protein